MASIFTRRLKVSNNDDWKEQLDIFTNDNDYTIKLTGVSDTIDTSYIDSSATMSSWTTDTLTIGSNPASTFTISTGGDITFGSDDITLTTHDPVDFVDQLPTLNKIQDMCAEYPGLSKAFDNFKVTYKMVHQDWMGKKKVND